MWPAIFTGLVATALLGLMAWQLAKVRGALALATRDINALKGQLDVLTARWEFVQRSWDDERSRLLGVIADMRGELATARREIAAVLSRPDVPPTLAGEWLERVLASDASTAPAGASAAQPELPVTRAPARTATRAKDGI